MAIVRKSILFFSLLLLIQHSFLPPTFRAENSASEMSKDDLEELKKKIKDLEHRLSRL